MKIYILISAIFWSLLSTAQNVVEQYKLTAVPRDSSANFGEDIDMYGNYAIVGARFDDTDASGQNPIQQAGSATILEKNTQGQWVVSQKIVANNRFAGQYFGRFVAIDSAFAVVGVPQDTTYVNGISKATGAVYVYKNTNGTWAQIAKLSAQDAHDQAWFGSDVDLHKNKIVIGSSAALNNGQKQGAVYVFEKVGPATWQQTSKIISPNATQFMGFGGAVAIQNNQIAVGSPADAYDENGLNPISNSGSVEIFENMTGNNWVLVKRLVPTNRHTLTGYGQSMAMHNNALLVGAKTESGSVGGVNNINNTGAAYLYEKQSGTWTLATKIQAAVHGENDYLGWAVDLHENLAVVGCPFDGDALATMQQVDFSGSAMVYEKQNGQWNFKQILTASDRDQQDYLGQGIAVYGNDILVGAPGQKENALGQNSLKNAGMVYTYLANIIFGEDEFELLNFDAYPNPANHTITVNFNVTDGLKTIEIYNMVGQLMYSAQTAGTEKNIPVSHFKNGVYTLKVSVGATENYLKFLVAHP